MFKINNVVNVKYSVLTLNLESLNIFDMKQINLNLEMFMQIKFESLK